MHLVYFDSKFVHSSAFSISEDISDTDIIGVVKAADVNGDEIGYSITTNSDGLFEITENGTLGLATDKMLNFETKKKHVITVEITDSKLIALAQIIIVVCSYFQM